MQASKRFLSLLLLFALLLSMLPSAFAVETSETLILDASVPSISQKEFENGTWNIDGRFRQIRPTLSKGAFWDSTKAGSYNKLITTDSTSANYFATPRFTREELPVGSVIVVEVGWQYCPEAWVTDTKQSSREAPTSQMFVQITEEWWGDYTLRAFNISKTDGSDLSDRYQSDIYEAFRIYVPDEYIPLGYERFYPKLEHCAYWDCTQTKITTRNSSDDALYYFTTQRMTKSQLPVGSIVVMDEGWEFRPEAWLTDGAQASRQPVSKQTYLEITAEWWGSYIRRCFNISRSTKTSMESVTTEEIHDVFRIYVPKKTTSIEGLSDEKTNATTKIHQLPSKTPIAEGDYEKTMSYILESREGKIIVIDGGYQTGNHDGKYLFAYLQRITGKAKPHVDAWFFTHPHPDHFAAFLTVASLYASQITVDAVYHGFPSGELAAQYHNKTADPTAFGKYYDKLVTHTAKLKNAKGETTPMYEVNSVHSGKCCSSFDFDEIHIDILLTYEDAYWAIDNITTKYSGTLENNGKAYTDKTLKQIASTNANESCMVFRASFGGKSVLFLGDASIVSEVMLTRYHEANVADNTKYFNLKSDIVQVSHHGVQSMGKAIYGLINPDIALWCTPYHLYASRPDDYHTTYHIRKWFRTTYATTNYITYDGVDVLSFPVVRSASAVSIPAELKPYVFDAEYYANHYADLKEAYGTDEAKLYHHFINYGVEEGRCASPFFDVKFYMNNNTQTFRDSMKGNYEKAFKDFLANYKSTSYMKLSPDFDPSYYVTKHNDLAGATQLALMQHFAANGYLNGEIASKTVLSKEGDTYHTAYTVTAANNPTCTEQGVTMGASCTNCGEVFIPAEKIPALGHSYEPIDTVPSCEDGTYIPSNAFFANFTGSSDRYTQDALYAGVNYDEGSNWSYLPDRYQAPTVNTSKGTLTTGFAAEGYNHIWIQTGASYNNGFNLKYQPQSDHIVKLRVKFDGLKVKTGASSATLNVNYFVGTDRYEDMGDKTERIYKLDAHSIANDKITSGDFVTLSFPVSGLDSTSHKTLTALRIQFSSLENTNSDKPGTITFDYIYIGPDNGNMLTYRCSTCADSYTLDQGGAFGHKEVIHESVAPTCTNSGLSEWKDCSVCGKVLVAQTVLPALGHSYKSTVTPVSCTEDGFTTKTCTTCGDTVITDRIHASGHTEVLDSAKSPTCTETGLTEGKHCSACGKVLLSQQILPALGHSYEPIDTVPSCEDGACIPDSAFFANFTGSSDRYTQNALYAGVNYDEGSNWSYLPDRYQAPTVNTSKGTLTTGFAAEGYNHIWIQTGASYNNGFNLKYQPQSDHIVKLRVKFDGLKVKTGASSATLYVNYFVGTDRYEDMGDKTERIYKLDSHSITNDKITSGDFVTFSFPVSGLDSTSHKTLTALRIQFSSLENTNSNKPGTITFDYIYIGPDDGKIVTYACTACDDSYTVDALAPLGHAPVYTDNSNKTHTITCKNCDYTETVSCEYEDGKCICGAKEVIAPIYDEAVKFSHSLTLENDISINFIGLGSALIGYDSFYLECKVPVYNGNELVGYETVKIDPVYNGKNYECTLLGVTAKMMNDDIEAVFRMTKDGQEYYSKTDVYSVAEYAYGKLDSTKATDTAELKAICANLLRYGSTAQAQFGYRTDALVDAAMTDAHKAFLTDLSTVEMKDYRKQLSDLDTVIVPWKSTTLELGNKVIMCLIANLANYSGDPSELTMRLTYTDSYGTVITEERPLSLYNPEALTYAVSYDGLRATEMRSVVSAAIYRNGERVSKTVEYSIESYGARSKDPAMQELCHAMLAYGDSANAFFSN